MQNKRPLSPHLQVWRWHWTMAASIGHRVTGGALYFGAFLLAAWVVTLGATSYESEAFNWMAWLITSPLGQLIVGLWVFAALLHMFNGLRYLAWSGPKIGFNPKIANYLTIAIIAVSTLGAVGIWWAAFN